MTITISVHASSLSVSAPSSSLSVSLATYVATLPFAFDPSVLSDGALPSVFVDSGTFAIDGGVIANTPTAGANRLTDPGLEANYTANKCDTLTMGGTPTLAQSADVHGGSRAQQFTAAAYNNRLNYPAVAGAAGAWNRFSIWAKRTAGTGADTKIDLYQAAMLPAVDNYFPITSAAYAKVQVVGITNSTANITPYAVRELGSSGFDTVIVDDGVLETLTYSELFSMLSESVTRSASVKIKPDTLTDGTLSGAVAWANANTSPDTYLLLWYRLRFDGTLLETGLLKCVNGTYSQVIAPQALTFASTAWLEIRPVDDSTVAMYYNDVQIGTNQTVSDVPGAFCGMVVSGSNKIAGFDVRVVSDYSPHVLITLDDGFSDNYTNALPILSAAGLKATMYLITGHLDDSGYVTTAQAQELITAGWSVGNHTQNDRAQSTMSYAESLAELQAAIADLIALGGSPYHYAYVGGDVANEDAVLAAGILTARTSDATPAFGLPSMIAQHLTARSVTNAVSTATIQGWIDDAIATRKVLILILHQVTTPADTTYKTTIADFQTIVNYLVSSGVSVLTIDELWTLYNAYN